MTHPVRHFCTYFDKGYLSRGLALYHSLRRTHPSLRLYAGCFDRETYEYLARAGLPDLVPLPIAELEAYDAALAATRSRRTRVEYFFTSTPSWLRFVLARFPEVDLLTYLDADLYFFSSSEPAFAEMGDAPIAIVEHHYPEQLRHLERFGRFNVGWLVFRRHRDAAACLDWWRDRCLEWCFDRVEGDRYGDQKYLDRWPTLFPSLHVLQHPGVDVAPWNLSAYRLDVVPGSPTINSIPLVCFHFQGLKHVLGPLYESGLRAYGQRLDRSARTHIFEPYLAELGRYEAELRRAGLTSGHARSQRYAETGLQRLLQHATRAVTIARLLLSGTYLLRPRDGRSSS